MVKFAPERTLILVALEDELPAETAPGWRVRYIGVGKVNAVLNGMAAIAGTRPRTVVNCGTAGALKSGVSGVRRVTRFLQRDMDVRGLGFALGETPFETGSELIDLGADGLSVGTGDSFVESPPELATDLVDMEAYALAKLCRKQGLEFHCYKYIADKADEAAANDWQASLRKGARLFAAEILGAKPSDGG